MRKFERTLVGMRTPLPRQVLKSMFARSVQTVSSVRHVGCVSSVGKRGVAERSVASSLDEYPVLRPVAYESPRKCVSHTPRSVLSLALQRMKRAAAGGLSLRLRQRLAILGSSSKARRSGQSVVVARVEVPGVAVRMPGPAGRGARSRVSPIVH